MKRVFAAVISFLFLVSLLATPGYARNNTLKKVIIGIGIGVGAGLLAREISKGRNRRYRKGKARHKSRHRGNRASRRSSRTRGASSRRQNKQLQNTLNLMGYDAGTADGVFGRQTREAIKQFQESRGERATGRLTRKQRGFLLGTNHKGNIYARPHYQKPPTDPMLTGYVPRNAYGSDRQMNAAIQKCEDSYKYHGGGYAGTAQKIWAKAHRCQEIATQNYRQKRAVTQQTKIYRDGKNNGERIYSLAAARTEMNRGGNSYLIIGKMKKSLLRGELSGLSRKQKRRLKLIKYSLRDQPLVNIRDGFGRLLSGSPIAVGVDSFVHPKAMTALNGGRNSVQNDRGRERVGTLYQGEIFVFNGNPKQSNGRTTSYAASIDNAKVWLSNFLTGRDGAKFSELEFVAGDNLQFSDDIDLNGLITHQVDRRANHSDIESKRMGNGVKTLGKAFKVLGEMNR